VLAIDLLEGTRAIDPGQRHRVAADDTTAAVVNTAKTPTVLELMGQEHVDVGYLERTIQNNVHPERYFGYNLGDLCERLLDTKLYANIMMLGVAYQLGYIPLTLEAIETALRRTVRRDVGRNMRAFHIGRKVVVKPEDFVVSQSREIESARQALRRKTNTLRAQYGWLSKRHGENVARRFRVLMKQTFRATRGLKVDDELMRDVIIRAYDCVIWGGLEYARRYCRRLVDIFEKDDPARGYAITRAVVWNLAKVMLIKDEVYTAAMLTNPEKYKRDMRRFNVNPARGDRIKYKHYNRPEFVIFGRKVRFHWHSRDWQLRIMAGCGFLRNVLPGWHRREREFRDWYERLVDQAAWSSDQQYEKWLAALRVPEQVTGFREIRYPKQEAARARAEAILNDDEPPHPGDNGDKGAASEDPKVRVNLSDRILAEQRV
jgi:indolepyruvate ferredoxin oxidoreductase